MKLKIELVSGREGLFHAVIHGPSKSDHVYFETRWHKSKVLAVGEIEQWIRGDVFVNDDGEYFIEMKQLEEK